ncbi:CGNR zinc finger domain-containing protein [Brevibacterium sp. GP-SGM9]|uniref:CGNR zinc finger domain-containing protein n=1 Tax=Brevibacterium sp. GP-SGM9 TaxID=3376990 RepID=UPI0039A46339
MQLNPYGEYAMLLAASLANDWPPDREEIESRTREFGMTMGFTRTPTEVADTRAVIDEWLAVVDTKDPARRAEMLNAIMADAAAYPRLVDHDDEGWHLHYRDEDQSIAHVLRAVICVGTALHLSTRGMQRLRRCAAGESPADPCANVVVDVTRNGRQRYCSVRCANRDAVRRHRTKTRTEAR